MEKETQFMAQGMDMKRFFLCVFRKWRYIIAITLIGTIIGSGLYLFVKVVIPSPKQYMSKSKYYLTFKVDEFGNETLEYNAYTWNEILSADPILGYTMTLLPDYMKRKEVDNAITGSIVSDMRLLIITVVTENKEETELIANKTKESLYHFVSTIEDIKEIELFECEEPYLVKEPLYVWRVSVLSAVISFLIGFFIICYRYVTNDCIYTTTDVKKRFGLHCIGILGWDKNLQEHVSFIKSKSPTDSIGFIVIGDDGSKKIEPLLDENSYVFNFEHMKKTQWSQLQTCGIVFLMIDWGMPFGNLYQDYIYQLEVQNIKITSAIIIKPDINYIRAYYFPKKF